MSGNCPERPALTADLLRQTIREEPQVLIAKLERADAEIARLKNELATWMGIAAEHEARADRYEAAHHEIADAEPGTIHCDYAEAGFTNCRRCEWLIE
jgi:hypothetical protein